MKTKLISSIIVVALAGCASPVPVSYRPVVDMKGVDPAKYEVDLAECRQYSTQVADAQQRAAAGAVGGALVGAAIGAIFGLRGQSLAQVAGSSAVVGGVAGADRGYTSQTDIVKACLFQRGYRVLGG
jgi:uncharacterized protein YcfJ